MDSPRSDATEKGSICPECGLLMAVDVFSGEGGATKGLMDAGFCVTAVDNDPGRLKNNPAPHKVLGDAIAYLLEHGHRFAFRWASPTCTGYSRGTVAIEDRIGKYDRLIAATREALLAVDSGPWVIENVEDAARLGEIRNPQMLCGRMYGLGARDLDGEPLILDRHRVFEATFDIEPPPHAAHGDEVVAGAYGGGRRARRLPQETIVEVAARDRHEARYVRKGGYVPRDQGVLEQMLGITWEMTQKGVYLCIPPVYAEHIGRRAMAEIAAAEEVAA